MRTPPKEAGFVELDRKMRQLGFYAVRTELIHDTQFISVRAEHPDLPFTFHGRFTTMMPYYEVMIRAVEGARDQVRWYRDDPIRIMQAAQL